MPVDAVPIVGQAVTIESEHFRREIRDVDVQKNEKAGIIRHKT